MKIKFIILGSDTSGFKSVELTKEEAFNLYKELKEIFDKNVQIPGFRTNGHYAMDRDVSKDPSPFLGK